MEPLVLINAYAQVLVGSIAEVLVCWAVIGSVSQALLQRSRQMGSLILAALIASVFFGVYHFAHSPPFNTVPLVVFLSVIGLVTSVFFFVSRDVYGTIAFHNFLGIFGVIGALDASGNLTSFERPIIPLLVMAVVALALLIAAHVSLPCPPAAKACGPLLGGDPVRPTAGGASRGVSASGEPLTLLAKPAKPPRLRRPQDPPAPSIDNALSPRQEWDLSIPPSVWNPSF